jgi:hypothetical protein
MAALVYLISSSASGGARLTFETQIRQYNFLTFMCVQYLLRNE